jgi:small-conductance mechanosensitive channel
MVRNVAVALRALNSPDARAGRRRRRAAPASPRSGHWRTFAGGQIDIVQADQAEQAAQQERAASAPDVLRYESARADALSQRALRAHQLVDEIERADRTLRRWLTDIGQDRAQRPWQDQLAAVGARALTVLNAVWGFELFAVEDTLEVQGQKVTTKRGVTVGKSVGALLIFPRSATGSLRGWHAGERTLTARFGIDAQQARTIRRWTMTAFGFVLLVLVLNLAQIPLTVFAFFGGALAIGVGFGTRPSSRTSSAG